MAIAGFTNYNKKIKETNKLLKKMMKKTAPKESSKTKYFKTDNILLGMKESIRKDLDIDTKKLAYIENERLYSIVLNGQIYNYNEIKKMLMKKNIYLETEEFEELIIKLYILYGINCLDYLKGAFSFCIYDEQNDQLFLVRDHLGVKPLYYAIIKEELFFSTEIKAILEYKEVPKIIDKEGIAQLFGLGPATSPGETIFKDIFEIKPGHYGIYKEGKLKINRYFKIKSYVHTDSIYKTKRKLRKLLITSIKNQYKSNKSIGCFLSGGIDSSIIAAVASKSLKRKEKLKTFSVDYIDNNINFKKSDFSPERDNEYINLMEKKYNLDHKHIVIDNIKLYDSLYEAMIARDMPAMADIDSSLLLFSKRVVKDISVSLSGEFADEMFCGYPWFYREDTLECSTFPWSINLTLRKDILNKSLAKKIDIEKYVTDKYTEALKDVPLENTLTKEDIQMKKYSYLTMNYFGLNLLQRSDTMGKQRGLEIRIPFADYDLAEYVYNIPWEMKNILNMGKGILRVTFKDILPKEIAARKKSPYPKTYDPNYTKLVKEELNKVINNPENKIKELVDIDFVKEILNQEEEDTRPWFGQLMRMPQFMAFLLQLEMWLNEYNIKLEIT